MGHLTRPDLTYVPIARVVPSRPGAINLITNELPYGPPESVLTAIADAARSVNR
jgi:histidinol-phosphate/aromatic aminotransferase/cobyric acid decarboxylase-like protein